MTNVSDDAIHTRRKRGQGDQSQKEPHKEKEREKSVKEIAPPIEMVTTGDDDEGGEDDGVVRCLCGLEDYPGPPIYDEDTKEGIKEGIEEPFITVADVTEDLAGFFVQCDVCKVWQHGGCVGIQSEEQSPDEYFCEKCRKELHKIFTAPNGYGIPQELQKQMFAFLQTFSPRRDNVAQAQSHRAALSNPDLPTQKT